MAEAMPPAKSVEPAQIDPANLETILFVDDEENILHSLRRLLRKQPYRLFFATSATEGLKILGSERIDLVVSDMRMPIMDGAQFLAEVRKRWPDVVRMLLTGHSDITATIDALNRGGIYRYISKPWDDQELLDIIAQGVRIRRLEREKHKLLELTQQQNKKLKSFNDELERRVQARTAELNQTADMLDMAYQQLKDSYATFVRIFSTVISTRPHLAKSRTQLVADLSIKLAEIMRMPENEIRDIYYAALLMDLGKLCLPDDMLERSDARLTSADMPIYTRYPVHGAMTLMAIAELEPTAQLIRSHTEYIDGSGFPDRSRGAQIPPGARIIRVARDFVGLQTGLMRVDRLSPVDAFEVVKAGAGKRYDSHVVKALAPLVQGFSIDVAMPNEDHLGVKQLKPGMVIARDVLNTNGILLIAKGFKLTAAIIDKLAAMEKMESQSLNFFILKEGMQLQ